MVTAKDIIEVRSIFNTKWGSLVSAQDFLWDKIGSSMSF